MSYRVGLGVAVAGDASEIRFTDFGRECTVGIVLDSTAVDAENEPTTTLRKGLVLGKVTESGKYKQYDALAEDGTETARLILEDEVDLLDESGTAADTEALGTFRGDFIAETLIGLDSAAKTALKGCSFDEDV